MPQKGKLPGVKIPEGIVITSDDKAALTDVDVTVFASPSAYIRKVSRRLAPYVRQRQIIVNVAKGVEENTLMPVCDIIKEEIPQADVCVLSGPSHAEFTDTCKLEMPFTLHAGECGSVQNIVDSVKAGAGRIGHGIAMRGYADLQKELAQMGIGIEMCPIRL